eukprot:CAMPEP_0198114032 /NCGR_PEP_ID=MMETSP1442-20131203/5537_1 /TAXON_ID= /ORGANISM="Craspedostauros australis, Strain CCMP3328" /LENGTH=129 /DNA_ID=CAMNT_0043771249 /DNA_START=59 /DNA_END=445 /DNA_ORIENTATION=+
MTNGLHFNTRADTMLKCKLNLQLANSIGLSMTATARATKWILELTIDGDHDDNIDVIDGVDDANSMYSILHHRKTNIHHLAMYIRCHTFASNHVASNDTVSHHTGSKCDARQFPPTKQTIAGANENTKL